MLYITIELTFLKDVNRTKSIEICNICHCWYFLNYSFTFPPNICSRCHDLLVMSINLSDIAILNKGSDYHCIISLISKSVALKLL